MDITITVSDETEQIIREKAEENGKPVSEFAAHFLEEKIKEQFSETIENKSENGEYENPFTPFIGMFSSGKTNTSTTYKEILRKEIDNRGGFGGS